MDNQAFKLLTDKLDELGKSIKDVSSDLSEVKKDLGHYKGFLGGVTFVFTVAWSGITYFISHFNRG